MWQGSVGQSREGFLRLGRVSLCCLLALCFCLGVSLFVVSLSLSSVVLAWRARLVEGLKVYRFASGAHFGGFEVEASAGVKLRLQQACGIREWLVGCVLKGTVEKYEVCGVSKVRARAR